jgi:NitT/TauT family transport system permease protein
MRAIVAGLARSGRAGDAWQTIASGVTLLLLWAVAAELAGSRLLPGPSEVGATILSEATGGPLLHHLGATFSRVALSFAIAMLIGTALGVLLGRLRLLDLWLHPWLVVLINVPAVVIIILTYIWLGLVESAVVLAVALNKVPMVALTVREGARNLDHGLLGMARLYRFGRVRTLTMVILPQLAPYLLASARTGLALIWKIVLVVELLGRSDGVGFMLQTYFQLYDVLHVFAYASAFMLCVLAIEAAILTPIDRRCTAWRL